VKYKETMPSGQGDDDVDRRIGGQVLRLRQERGLSQLELAERIGVSYQQIQKYEKGDTRITVRLLYALADALSVSVSQLLDVAGSSEAAERSGRYRHEAPSAIVLSSDELQFVKLLRKIHRPKVRRVLWDYMKTIIEGESMYRK
jgi:transcriptional regulator with XRE-family HTH domain